MRDATVKDGKKRRKPGPVRTRTVVDADGVEREAPRLSDLQLVIGDRKASIGTLEQQGIGFVWKGQQYWCGTFSLCHLGDGEVVLTQVANRLAFVEYGQGRVEREKPMGQRSITRALVAIWRKDGGLQDFLSSAKKLDDEAVAVATVRDVIES